MQPAIRQYYNLEEIWGDKPVRLKFGAAKPAAPVKASPEPVAKKAPAKKPAAKKASAKTAAKTAARTARGTAAAVPAKKAPARKSAKPVATRKA